MDRRSAIVSLTLLALPACGRGGAAKAPPEILQESWQAYLRRFVQQDGRVIDRRAQGISTSEGQAYCMLRAVWMKDHKTFDEARTWAVNNLNAGVRKDRLWAWKWGRDPAGKWRALDHAFATDADQDAALALILAERTWKDPAYGNQARAMLADLWNLATVQHEERRYLLAGDTLCKGNLCRVNPSYYAPYAYRIFGQFDPAHNWNELVDSSYSFLDSISRLTATRLPPDWVDLDRATGALRLGNAKDSVFSYDAFRTCWRVALDYYLYKDPRAEAWLKTSLNWMANQWNKEGRLPAVISSSGQPEVQYQSLEMLGGLMPAIRLLSPEIAAAMNRKLQSVYANGIWGENDSYYLQNWAWFGTAVYLGYIDF